MRTTFVIHLTADTHPVDPGDPVLQQEIGDTVAAAICDQIANGRWPNAAAITADVIDVHPAAAPTVPVEPLDEAPHDGPEEPLGTGWQPQPGDLAELIGSHYVGGVAVTAGTRAHVRATGEDMAIVEMTVPGVRLGVHFEDLRPVGGES